MTTNHTPGPWELRGGFVESKKFTICEAFGEQTSEADLRLIASAPDLMVALENLVETHDAGEAMHVEFWNIARAAIARAKGEA